MIEWTESARADLLELAGYLSSDDQETAARIARSIVQTVRSLEPLPGRGRPGRVEGTRELLVPQLPYVVVYQAGAGVRVLRVLHQPGVAGGAGRPPG